MRQNPPAIRRPDESALRRLLRTGLWLAAAGSLACTLYAGRENKSVLLVAMFAVWVLSPFLGLAVAELMAARAPRGLASAIRASALVISIGSLALYVVAAASPPGHHKAFAFLAIPTVSWFAILPMMIAPRFARKR